MPFDLRFTEEAAKQFESLQSAAHRKQYAAVKKALALLRRNPRHPGLHTHAYESIAGPGKAKVWEAYAENQTPGAWRLFWSYYPPESNTITILAITPHP